MAATSSPNRPHVQRRTTVDCRAMAEQPRRRVVLALMAHPDDAEILCAGTMMRLVDSGWEAHVATMTAGDCGTTEVDRWQIMAIRTFEARAAAEIIGATYYCLGEA